jgi:hypothetical protein
MGEMSFWDRWYWANYLKGTNPITTFIRGLIFGIWIPPMLSAVLFFFMDPQWRRHESMAQWNPIEYVKFYWAFWGIIFYLSESAATTMQCIFGGTLDVSLLFSVRSSY